MKDIIKYFGSMAACAVGWLAGCWLWEEILEEKADDFKEKLSNKKGERA